MWNKKNHYIHYYCHNLNAVPARNPNENFTCGGGGGGPDGPPCCGGGPLCGPGGPGGRIGCGGGPLSGGCGSFCSLGGGPPCIDFVSRINYEYIYIKLTLTCTKLQNILNIFPFVLFP